MKNVAGNKRQKIIAAAADLFRRTHDVKRVSIEDIAAKASVSPTTIYNNFGNRESLVLEVIKNIIDDLISRNTAFIRSNSTFPEKMVAMVSGKLTMLENVNREIVEKLVGQDENVARFMDVTFKQQIFPLLKEIVEQGKKEGYIDPALNNEALIIYFDVLRAGFSTRPDVFSGPEYNMALIEQLTNIVFYGFIKKRIDLFSKEDRHGRKFHRG